MAFFHQSSRHADAVTFIFASFLTASPLVTGSNFYQDFDITWGDGRAQILNNGDSLSLSLDSYSGSGFQSKQQYLFGKFDMQLKLVPGNSAGTVTALYLSSDGPNHDEIDFEFLGNVSGEPYTVHTNVYSQGRGETEQQFRLWFDPTADFHTYSVLWTPQTIVLSVDDMPVREFKNLEKIGVAFPKQKAMRLYSSIWNADEWATRGGMIKTDWSQAPFTAAYRGFGADACAVQGGGDAAEHCSGEEDNINRWRWEMVEEYGEDKLKWVRENYMIYNYCNDVSRFSQGLPAECSA